MINENLTVSLFKNYRSNTPKDVNLWEWLKDTSCKGDIEYLRKIDDKDAIRIIKAGLPAITPSGQFLIRQESGLIRPSGLMCVDIDASDNPHIIDFDEQRDQLCHIANIAYCSLSASGRGVFCLIPIRYPEKHKQHFEALKLNFKKLGIIIDKNCGDVTRLRGYSYDAKAYLNKNAVVYDQLFDDRIATTSTNYKIRTGNRSKGKESTQQKVQRILAKIEETCTDITGDYGQWFQIGCALASEFHEEGREMFNAVSRYSEKYNPGKANGQFTKCLEGTYDYNIGTFFHFAAESGLI